MQLKKVDHMYTNIMEPICVRDDVFIPPNDRHLVLMASQRHEDTTATGRLQPSNTVSDDGNFAFCAVLVILANRQVEVHPNNFSDRPYSLTVLTSKQMN